MSTARDAKIMVVDTFPREVLDRVRVIDTDVEGCLPAIINELQTNSAP